MTGRREFGGRTLLIRASSLETLDVIGQCFQILRACIAADRVLDLIACLLECDEGTAEFGGIVIDHLGECMDITACRGTIAESVVSNLVVVPLSFLPVSVPCKGHTFSRSDVFALRRACRVQASR